VDVADCFYNKRVMGVILYIIVLIVKGFVCNKTKQNEGKNEIVVLATSGCFSHKLAP
jgi:hypothetical protein